MRNIKYTTTHVAKKPDENQDAWETDDCVTKIWTVLGSSPLRSRLAWYTGGPKK